MLIGHLVWSTLSGRTEGLLESLRSSRFYFVVLFLFVTIAAALSELIPRYAMLDYRTGKVIAITPALIFGALWMVRFKVPTGENAHEREIEPALSARDQILLQKLVDVLIERGGFRDPSIAIVKLASDLAVGQHRLRKLINAGLGYANFSSFLNTFRVNAVCEAMRDPAKADLPILTLSLDAGFKSLSAFNQAFKTATGMTPRQYRSQPPNLAGENARNPSYFYINPQDAHPRAT